MILERTSASARPCRGVGCSWRERRPHKLRFFLQPYIFVRPLSQQVAAHHRTVEGLAGGGDMTAFPEIVIAGLVLAMLGVLWNPLRELKADLECYKLGERLR